MSSFLRGSINFALSHRRQEVVEMETCNSSDELEDLLDACINDECHSDEDVFTYHSRLSMTMQAIINDPNCLGYFIQYLERMQALALLKFYLDVQCFKTASLSHLEQERQRVATVKHLREGATNGAAEEKGSEEDHNDTPELNVLCDMSMGKPLTDDEKSQLWLNHSRCKLQPHSSELSLCDAYAGHCHATSGCESESDSVSMLQVSTASIKDAIAIYQKYLRIGSKYFVQLPVGILSQISLLLCNSDEKTPTVFATELPVSVNCFVEAQEYVLHKLENIHLNDFLQSSFYCRYCVDIIENATADVLELNIRDLLHSESTLFFFMEFLAQRGERRECLNFWTAAINFRKSCQHEKHRPSDTQADAMVIYEKFFSLQSSSRLSHSDQLRSHVEEHICTPERTMYCFDLPLRLVVRYLERKHFAAFLQSQLFQSYFNELKLKAHEPHNNNNAHIAMLSTDDCTSRTQVALRRSISGSVEPTRAVRHRKTLSDCTTNTLLAMDSSATLGAGAAHIKHIQTAAGGASMNIDARQLTDPNLLWRRASSGGPAGVLQFGRVNSLGRYERDFQTVDASYSGSGNTESTGNSFKAWSLANSGKKLKHAMRKLVHLPAEDKAQEEIAWQMAEMIVRDVTSLTLHGAGSPTAAIADDKEATMLKR